MMRLLNLVTISTILSLLLSSLIMMAKSQEVEDEREFSYESGGEKGPEHWGEIHEEWSACGKGKMQSPIDLSHDRVRVVHHLGRLRRTYRSANAILKNRGHDIMLKWDEGAGSVFLKGTEYQIKQLHWHSPSEHSINGRSTSGLLMCDNDVMELKAIFGLLRCKDPKTKLLLGTATWRDQGTSEYEESRGTIKRHQFTKRYVDEFRGYLLGNEGYDLELHMVHENVDKNISVVGIMYKIGRPDQLLARMEDYIRKLKDIVNGEEKVGMVNPREVKWGSRKYYRYLGSLTTPPCTEGVTWNIINKVRTVSKEQLHMLRESVHDESEVNARPEQEIHDRGIDMYRPQIVQY